MSTAGDLVDLQRYITLQKEIANELDARIKRYQQRTATRGARIEGGARPLNLLADGDSWFDYPLDGDVPLIRTDILSQLGGMGDPEPIILSLAHYGDAMTREIGLARRKRITKILTSSDIAGFDAILVSGGGDDVVGDPMAIWLNHAAAVGNNPKEAIDTGRFDAILAVIRVSYESLAELRDRHAPGVPIFVHDYDFAIPSDVGVCTLGPWLKPALDYFGWTDETVATGIVRDMLTRFSRTLGKFAAGTHDVILVHTQGTLQPSQWANELHPTPAGFRLLATKFQAALATRFPGRI